MVNRALYCCWNKSVFRRFPPTAQEKKKTVNLATWLARDLVGSQLGIANKAFMAINRISFIEIIAFNTLVMSFMIFYFKLYTLPMYTDI